VREYVIQSHASFAIETYAHTSSLRGFVGLWPTLLKVGYADDFRAAEVRHGRLCTFSFSVELGVGSVTRSIECEHIQVSISTVKTVEQMILDLL
jgi:hypothetical protein